MLNAKFVWIADPWTHLDHPFDTTSRLATESIIRGNSNYWCSYADIYWNNGAVVLPCQLIREPLMREQPPRLEEKTLKQSADFDVFVMRADPPITEAYKYAIQFLAMDLEQHGRDPERCVVNPPRVLLGHNDKLLAFAVPDLVPETIISSRISDICDFGKSYGMVVLKPLHNHQGGGIQLIDFAASPGTAHTISEMTKRECIPIVAQRFLRKYRETEKRVWFLDGAVLAVCVKEFQKDGFPPQLKDTSYVSPAALSGSEEISCQRLGHALRNLGIRIAGVDFIDGYLTDVNVVSPGLIIELERLYSINLASAIIGAMERGYVPTQTSD